jgi:ATPase family associated with various cellular activities (AAA)
MVINPEALTLEDILPLINMLLSSKGYETLDSAQIAVIRASWEGIDYKDMAERTPFSWGKLHREVAPPLWTMLSDALGHPVSKRKLRQTLERLMVAKTADSLVTPLNIERKVIGRVPTLEGFIGRKQEIDLLSTYLCDQRCIYLTGPAGIGKTSLMAAFFNKTKVDLIKKYDIYFWKYCTASSPSEDMNEFRQILNLPSDQSFISFIRLHKSFICIDGIEGWFKNNQSETEKFIQQISESEHSSCVIFTSRQPLFFIDKLRKKGRPIISVQVNGLSSNDALNLMNVYEIAKKRVSELIKSYSGSPLLLNAAAKRLKGLSESNVERFIQHKTSMTEEFYLSSYSELFNNNSQIGEAGLFVLSWFVKVNTKNSINKNDLISEISKTSYRFVEILEAVDVLKAYALILSDESMGYEILSLPHDLRKYINRDPLKIFSSDFHAVSVS